MTYAFKPLLERLRDPALMKRWWDQYGLEAADEIERLEKLVYVPGLWRCAKCACETVSAEIHAESGRMRAGQSPQACPNGCGPMWRITERDAGNRLIERMDPMQEEITRLRAALETADKLLREAFDPIQYHHDDLGDLPERIAAHVNGGERAA